MFFSQIVTVGTLLLFFTNLITNGHGDKLTRPNEIPRSHQEETILNDWDILFDYVEMELIRRSMVRNFPNGDFFFIGNTLAYVGLMMVVRGRLTGSTSGIIQMVPFSGSHIDIIRNTSEDYELARNATNRPAEGELEYFQERLRMIGLDPRSILERYERFENRTVIVQDIGTGLVSFLDILCKWSELEGISPDRLRTALGVFTVIFEDNGFPDTSVITIGEYSIDITRMVLTSESSLATIRRIAYPDRNTGYVRLLPNYPSRLWNEPPPEFDQHHSQRLNMYMNRLVVVMRQLNIRFPLFPTTSSTTVSSNSESDLDLVCRPRESRFKRDSSDSNLMSQEIHMIFNSNEDVLKILKMEYEKSLKRNMSPWDFVEDQLKNSSSAASKILQELCDKRYYYYSFDEDETVSSELLHFSSNETKIFECIKRYKLFRCGEPYESSGIVEKIATLAKKRFTGAKISKNDVNNEVENLVNSLVSSYSKSPVHYVIEATQNAALYCSNEKKRSTLKCPPYYIQIIGKMMIAWFVERKKH